MPSHRIIVATHARDIHFLRFDTDAPALQHLGSKQLSEQASWVETSPVHSDLIYVNSWIDNKIFVLRLKGDADSEVVSECDSGGAGPTYMKVTPDRKGLLVVNYAGGTLSYLPLEADGTFTLAAPDHRHIHHFPYSPPGVDQERQDGSHPHHIIQLSADSDVLIPCLGSDRVWWMRWAGERWQAVDSLVTPPGSGPRHGVLDDSGRFLYLLHELQSFITVHELNADGADGKRISDSLKRVECLPELLRGIRSRYGPYDLIACSILLLPPVPGESDHTLIATNRMAPPTLAPQGDSIASYRLPDPTKPTTLEDPDFVYSASQHVRGIVAGPVGEGEEAYRYVVTMGRNNGGLTVFKREAGGRLVPIISNVLEKEIALPVGAVWLP